MPLTLYVDGPRWRERLRAVADASPGLVPVAKGNGYGFGLGRLGPVSEGLWGWLVGIGLLVGVAVWIGAKGVRAK